MIKPHQSGQTDQVQMKPGGPTQIQDQWQE
jgi:hypothetical protein